MNGTTYGYIRVSSKDQNEDRQRIAMQEAGVDERHIFMDKQSGKRRASQQQMQTLSALIAICVLHFAQQSATVYLIFW